jgi:hypothetical protein
MWRALLRYVPGLIACTFAPGAVSAIELTLSLGTLEAPNFRATAVKTSIGDKVFSLAAGEVVIVGRTFRNVNVTCGTFRFEPERVECRDGVLETGGSKMPVAFLWHPKTQALELTAVPQPKETWRLETKTLGATRRSQVDVANGSLANLAGWIPGGLPRTSAGTFEGRFVVDSSSEQSLWGQITVRGAAFSDAGGAHAGEKLDAVVRFFAQPSGAAWRWNAALEWTGGEVYWQPVYQRAIGQELRAEGLFDARRIAVHRASLKLPGIGDLEAAGLDWDRTAGRVLNASLKSGSLDAAAFYKQVLQPHLAGTAASDLKVAGALEVASLRMRDAEMEAVDIVVRDLTFEDQHGRFAVFGANGRVPWHHSEETRLDLRIKGGEALKIPFGAMKLPLAMRGMRFRLEQTEIPVLDGKLIVKGFASDPPGDEDWRWAFSGAVAPMSMERFTQAVGWPVMHGVIAAQIPRVSFSRSTLRVGGAFIFNVFDGTVEMRNISLADPFGKAPRLTADLDMKHLDLDLLTRTFSFGSMKGRVDAEVTGMELSNWRPVRFDVRVKSSPGDYPRKISQKAVENITALGGASAAAAAQRMFLRFFQQFDYETLGWSCRLEKGVCRMGGVENTANGYVIVKGSGVPALSVLGYNRDVNWEVLVERVKRVAEDNVRAVVQ